VLESSPHKTIPLFFSEQLQEEKDMWQQRGREKKREREKDDWSIRASVTADPSLVRYVYGQHFRDT